MEEPFRTAYYTLILKSANLKLGKWNWGVKLTENHEAIYIGDDGNHITLLRNVAGFHHTESGGSANGQHLKYTTLEQVLDRVDYNPEFYTRTIRDALAWLISNKTEMT